MPAGDMKTMQGLQDQLDQQAGFCDLCDVPAEAFVFTRTCFIIWISRGRNGWSRAIRDGPYLPNGLARGLASTCEVIAVRLTRSV